tara:strand:- start:213 stop:515 length:303 start_codon:yes stop_codon:yes gene_type:complete
MKLKNIIIGIFLINTLSGCAQNVALLGPAITLGTTGNVMQAGIQYGTNQAIKQETGKDALTFISDVVEEDQRKKKFNKEFVKLLETRIKETREQLDFPNQ